LAGDLRYYLEVVIEVQDREPSQLGARCDDQVGYRRRAVLAAIGEQREHFHRPVLDRGGEVFAGMDDNGGCRNPARSSGPDRAE
jgi:hypothetical protein